MAIPFHLHLPIFGSDRPSHDSPQRPSPQQAAPRTPQHAGNTYRLPLPPLLSPLRRWVNQIRFTRAWQAHWVCRLIPCTCPFSRTIQFRGRVLLRIPPLCKLNPLYTEVVALRLRALSYLSDDCHENIDPYIC